MMKPGALDRAMLVVATPLAFVSPILNFLGTQGIPLFVRPALLLAGGVGGLGLVIGGIAAALQPSSERQRVRTLLFVAALIAGVFVVIDIAAGGHWVLAALTPAAGSLPGLLGRSLRLAAMIGCAVPAFAAMWLVRKRAARLLSLCAAAFFVSTVAVNTPVFAWPSTAIPPVRSTPTATDQPLFLYIVLDEGMGVEGLERAPGGADLATDIRSFAARHGFLLHGGAFSRHFVSGRSIPNILNFDTHDDGYGPFLAHSDGKTVDSLLFQRLASSGYQVVSYGTRHVDFCFHEAQRCEVMPSFSPYSPYIGDDDGAQSLTNSRSSERKALTVYFFARQVFIQSYVVYHYLEFLMHRHPTSLPPDFYTVDAYQFPKWFDRLTDDVVASPRGRAYFVHLLMPHSPYVLDANCRETGAATVGYFLTEQHGLRGEALDRERERIYAEYEAQYRCALRSVDRLMNRIETVPRFNDATIVIEGDHGARISAGMFAESLSHRDMIDNYSALYAIRRPDLPAGYDARKTSVQRLAAEYFSGATAASLGPDNLTVAIDSTVPGNVVVRPMPDFDAAGAD